MDRNLKGGKNGCENDFRKPPFYFSILVQSTDVWHLVEMENIAVQWSMDIGQSIAESRSTEMFWMKNHSSAYFILLPWPILGKFIILVPLLKQNSLPHITVFTINSTESKEWMNLSLHASLWTLHRLRLAQTLTPLLPRILWNIGSIYYFAAKIIGSKGKRGKGTGWLLI